VSIMDSIGALRGGVVVLGAFVSRRAGSGLRCLRHTRPPMEAIPLMMTSSVGVQTTNLWALRKDVQAEDEHRRISEQLAMTLYRHSE
jgi:hypothetical protein